MRQDIFDRGAAVGILATGRVPPASAVATRAPTCNPETDRRWRQISGDLLAAVGPELLAGLERRLRETAQAEAAAGRAGGPKWRGASEAAAMARAEWDRRVASLWQPTT